MNTATLPKVKLTMIGLDSNAFAVMGAFKQQARRDGWTPEQIKEVLDDAMSKDYSHLISTIMEHCKNSGAGPMTDEEDGE